MLLRHHFVWLDPDLAASGADAEETALVAAWLRAGHPAIIRRSEIELKDRVALGIALPTRLGRRRIALQVPEGAIIKQAMPPHLADALICAPAAWRDGLQVIASDLARRGADVHVYGSLGWQYLTGEIYLRPQSDIDLLIVPHANCDTEGLLAALERYARYETPRPDGEIIIGCDRAVAWRELLMPSDGILVRGRVRLAVEPRADVLVCFRRKAAA